MTYASGGLIQATDYNNLINGTNQLNAVWSTGNGDAGYGQTAIPVVVGPPNAEIVTAAQWASLINSLNKIRQHQTGSGSGITAPTAGTIITYLSTLQTAVNSAYTDRALAASNGTTIVGTDWGRACPVVGPTTATSVTLTLTATFTSAQHARYFFNAGGLLSFVFNGINNNGTPRSQSGVDVINGLNTAHVKNNVIYNYASSPTPWGYRGLTTGPQQTRQVNSSTYLYSTTTATLYFFGTTDTTNGANGNTVSCRVTVYVPADDAFGQNCNFTLNMRCNVTPPESANLSASAWGTPTITAS